MKHVGTYNYADTVRDTQANADETLEGKHFVKWLAHSYILFLLKI